MVSKNLPMCFKFIIIKISYLGESFPLKRGGGVCVDSSYHVQTNVSTQRVMVQDTSVHSIHKGEVLFFSSVYIYIGGYIWWLLRIL